MKKAAFSLGARYGRGFSMCRRADGVGWSAPAAIRVEGGSLGFRIAISRGLFAGISLQRATLRPEDAGIRG